MRKAMPKSKVSSGGQGRQDVERVFCVPTVVIEDDMANLNTPTVEQVCVHVYDVSLNQKGTQEMSAYHSGIEIYGREWSFGCDSVGCATGIIWGEPVRNPSHTLRGDTISIGYAALSPKEIVKLIEEMRPFWQPAMYDTLSRNSHHFADALGRRLGLWALPTWLHKIADNSGEKSGRVFLRVYDLGQTLVTVGYNMVNKNFGAFHTGVEVYGREWSFGGNLDPLDDSTGVGENPPGDHPCHSFRETLMMGCTQYNPEEVLAIIQELMLEWPGNRYNMLSRNCHNFSDTFCKRLGVTGLPPWVNDLASSFNKPSELSGQPEVADLQASAFLGRSPVVPSDSTFKSTLSAI